MLRREVALQGQGPASQRVPRPHSDDETIASDAQAAYACSLI